MDDELTIDLCNVFLFNQLATMMCDEFEKFEVQNIF